MERPLVRILLVGTLLAVSVSFASLCYVQGQNFAAAARQSSATSAAYAVAGAVASAAADAKVQGLPVSSVVLFSQPVAVTAGGRTVTVSPGGTGNPVNSSITLTAPVNIAAVSVTALALNVTAYPDGTVHIVRT
jgi:hypothetical protein